MQESQSFAQEVSAQVDALDGADVASRIDAQSVLHKTGVDSMGKDVFVRFCVLGGGASGDGCAPAWRSAARQSQRMLGPHDCTCKVTPTAVGAEQTESGGPHPLRCLRNAGARPRMNLGKGACRDAGQAGYRARALMVKMPAEMRIEPPTGRARS